MPQEREEIRRQVDSLPEDPGVYIFKDEGGRILYIGKAANLKSRVRSYFADSHLLSPKLSQLVPKIRKIDFIATDSEQEAFLLEWNLIKEHRPPFNIRLRDDKSYPYLKITLNEEWPRVVVTRRLEDDGSRYFGPFAGALSLRKTLKLLSRLFPFRTCNKKIPDKSGRPCLKYYIHRCCAPCTGKVDPAEYRKMIERVVLFLEGRHEEIKEELWRRMEEAAEKLEFEKAALLRDQLFAMEKVMQKQKVILPSGEDADILALAREGGEVCVQVFRIRGGRMLGADHFLLEGAEGEAPSRIFSNFIRQFYTVNPFIPSSIILPSPPEDEDLLRSWLRERAGREISIEIPEEGEKRGLLEMAERNALASLRQERIRRMCASGAGLKALEELKELLLLPRLPRRIECYDISDIRGDEAVGSMVVFEEGMPKPSSYRRFRIRCGGRPDDYAMMREVLQRRFSGEKIEDKRSSWSELPDLVLIDGGKGHLNVALSVLRERGLDIPAASIAKEEEKIYTPFRPDPLTLPSSSSALRLLQQIRDEAHRFAISYHRKVRARDLFSSKLEEIPGIGPKRRKMILRKFGSLDDLRRASLEEIAALPGMTLSLARRIKEHLSEEKAEEGGDERSEEGLLHIPPSRGGDEKDDESRKAQPDSGSGE